MNSATANRSVVAAAVRRPRVSVVAALLATVPLAACASGQPAPSSSTAAPHPSAPPAAPPIAQRARGSAARAQAGAVRIMIDAALREGAEERWRRRRALTFTDGGAVFSLDDAWALLAQAPRPRRGQVLLALAPAVAAAAKLDDDERARVRAAADAAGVEIDELYARRIGLDARALGALVDGALAATGQLLGPVAGDVTLVPDVLAPPPWRAKATVAPVPAGVGAPSTGWALWYGGVPRPPTPDDAAAYARSLAVELRLAALSVRALMTSPGEHDALASRALVDDAELVPGAAALLDVDASGSVVERFEGLLRAPGVARAIWSGEAREAVVRHLEAAPPADEEGYPEAFIAVAIVLPASL